MARIRGTNKRDVLQGGGADTLIGGNGNDVCFYDGDDIINESGFGIDQVLSSVTYTLPVGMQLENLTLLGSLNINGHGNALSNSIIGNGARTPPGTSFPALGQEHGISDRR